jgi:hypothetical protein
MKKREAVFLGAVAAFAVTFVAVTLSNTARSVAKGPRVRRPETGAAGEARDVDMQKLKRLLLHGYLSDREAEYYEKLPEDQEAAPSAEEKKEDVDAGPPAGGKR